MPSVLLDLAETKKVANWNQLIARAHPAPNDDTISKLNFINLILMNYESARIPEKPDPEFESLYISKLRTMDKVSLPETFIKNKELINSVDEDGRQTVKIKVNKAMPKRESTVKQHNWKKSQLLQALPPQCEAANDFVSKVAVGTPEMPDFNVTYNTDGLRIDHRDYQTNKLAKAAGLHYIKVNQTFLKAQRLGKWFIIL